MTAVELEGHAEGQMGLLVRTGTGPVFLVADAVWHSRALREGVYPGLISRLISPSWPDFTALFGDAAAAVVVGRSGAGDAACLERAHFATYSEGVRLAEIHAGATFEPTYHYLHDDHSDFLFNMQGRRVLRLARRYLPDFLESLHSGLSHSLDGIDVVIPHQASRMGLKLAGGLKWSSEKIVQTLASLGNTIAASIPITLHQAIETGRLERGMRTLLIGTGAGLSIGDVILRY